MKISLLYFLKIANFILWRLFCDLWILRSRGRIGHFLSWENEDISLVCSNEVLKGIVVTCESWMPLYKRSLKLCHQSLKPVRNWFSFVWVQRIYEQHIYICTSVHNNNCASYKNYIQLRAQNHRKRLIVIFCL